jgi:LacI family transcriptional regulator
MAATIKDVARTAGCSIKTVSRVINNEPYVKEELRTRVQTAIRELGYAPNISARRLAQNKSYMICILLYPGFFQPASQILSTIMDITHDEDYDILIQPYFPSNKRSRNKLVELIAEHRIDGFVITPPCDSDSFLVDMLVTYKVPLVQINPFEPTQQIPSVNGDDRAGAFEMTEHLISLGHQQISFLMGSRNMRSSFDRLEGYKSALKAHQLPFEPRLVENSENTFDGGYTACKLLLQRNSRLTAVFAGNDEAAYGVLYALQELNISVPGRISVSGFEDLALSKKIWPGLTTIHQPSDDMIAQATHMLIRILKEDPPREIQILLPSQLVVRGSTGLVRLR